MSSAKTSTADEAARLREILASAFSDLRMEMAYTDAMDFHGLLKQRKAFLWHRTCSSLEGRRSKAGDGIMLESLG
jgi:hypothetical protein